jgi:glycosyltransferase involved in cell wall biosynthesis
MRAATPRLPRITIVTPSFNQGRFLEAALLSVLDQGYPDLEYIVMDGGSTDGSVEIIRRHAARLARWHSGPDGGQAAAIAAGFRDATGDVLAWLNSDDILLPGALDTVGRAFAADPGLGLVYGARRVIDEAGRVLRTYHPPTVLHRYYFSFGQWIAQESAFWRRSLYESAGGMDESKFFALDLSLFMRMWGRGRWRRLDTELGAIRVHPDTKTNRRGDVMHAEAEALRRAHGIPHFQSWLVNQVVERIINRQARVEHRAQPLVDAARARLRAWRARRGGGEAGA